MRKLRSVGFGSLALGIATSCALTPSGEESAPVALGQGSQAIVGGSMATPGEYPWMAQISVWNSAANEFVPACGGSLIAKRWILTAAHCLRSLGQNIAAGDIRVTLGEHDLSTTEASEQVIPVANVITHPDFEVSTTVAADIGLLELASDAQLNSRVQIIRLATGNDGPGVEATLSGFGLTVSPVIPEPPEPPILRELDVVVTAPDQEDANGTSCNDTMLANSLARRSVFPDEMCSYNFLNEDEDGNPPYDYQSGCYGDSGSPLVAERGSGCFEQIGIHTTGDEFCISYDVGTRVSGYLGWISSHVDDVYEAEGMFHSTGSSHPGGWNIHSNGYASFVHSFSGGQQQMVVRASGQNGNGWPNMQVTVNGAVVYNTTVASPNWTDYTVTFNAPVGNAEVRVYFTNDYFQAPVDRNLFLDRVTLVNLGSGASCSPGAFEAALDVYDDWGTGYCARLELSNGANVPTTGWSVTINTGNSAVYQWWNSPPIAGTGSHLVVPVGWNAAIGANTTINSTGFCANRAPGTTTLPVVVSASATY